MITKEEIDKAISALQYLRDNLSAADTPQDVRKELVPYTEAEHNLFDGLEIWYNTLKWKIIAWNKTDALLQRENYPDGVEVDYHWRLVSYKELFNYGISVAHKKLGTIKPLAYPTKE
jgi:hypothetical protein